MCVFFVLAFSFYLNIVFILFYFFYFQFYFSFVLVFFPFLFILSVSLVIDDFGNFDIGSSHFFLVVLDLRMFLAVGKNVGNMPFD